MIRTLVRDAVPEEVRTANLEGMTEEERTLHDKEGKKLRRNARKIHRKMLARVVQVVQQTAATDQGGEENDSEEEDNVSKLIDATF